MARGRADNKVNVDAEKERAMERKKRHRGNTLFWASHNRQDHSRDRGQGHSYGIDADHPFDQPPHKKAPHILRTPNVKMDEEEL